MVHWCLVLMRVVMLAGPDPGAAAGELEFELVRSTIDGGGRMFSAGGEWELSGTIGQPDAGQMSDGDFTLSGGFWFETPPADCNADGLINRFDYGVFQFCLAGPAGKPLEEPCRCFDANRSGKVDLADFATVQNGFTGG